MHYDALTLACVTHELQNTLVGGRIQQVVLPDAHSVGLEVYARPARRYLLLSAQPGNGRVHLMGQKLRRGVEKETPLLLLLRKYARGSILDAVRQPDPTERIMHLVFDHPAHGVTTLVAEPMGRLSNLFLLKPDNTILECVHRVRPGEHALRVLLPGRAYTPPPAQDRLSPWDDGRDAYYDDFADLLDTPDKLWRVIANGIAGASPTVGREVAYRAAGDVDAAAQAVPLPAVVQALQELWSPVHDSAAAWQPGVWLEEGQVVGYSAYPVHFRPGFIPSESISAAIEAFMAARDAGTKPAGGTSDAVTDTQGEASSPALATVDPYAAQRKQAAAQVARARRRVERQLAALAGDEPDADAARRLRTEAEWLLALQHQIEPGQTTLTVDLGDGETLDIALDPTLTPVELAQRKFKQAGRAERAAEFIPQRRARLQSDLAYVDELAAELALAENQPEIAAVIDELRRSDLLPPSPNRRTPPAPKPAYLRFYGPGGEEIVVGRNARQNDYITFTLGRASDLWLHVRDAPGAHVLIRTGGRAVDEATKRMAAQLAAYYSARRGDRAVPVAITEQRLVTRQPGGRPGQVHFRGEETMVVPAVLPEEG